MTSWQQVAIGVLALLGGSGGLVALVRVFTDRPKVQADAASIIATSAATQMIAMEGRLGRVETKYDGVVLLLDDTRAQLEETDRKAVEAERKVARLARYQKRASAWHSRHLPFDQVMQDIVSRLRPDQLDDPAVLDAIPPLEDFPEWEELPGEGSG